MVGVVVERRELRPAPLVVVDAVEVERAEFVAAGRHQLRVAVVVLVVRPRDHVRRRAEAPRAVRHERVRGGAVDAAGRLVHEPLDVRHVDPLGRPPERAGHPLGLVEDLPRDDGGVIGEGLDHRRQRVVDVGLREVRALEERPVLRQLRLGPPALEHVERPQAKDEADLVLPGEVEDGLQVFDRPLPWPGDHAHLGRAVGRRHVAGRVEPEPHGVPAARVEVGERLLEAGEVRRPRPDVAGEVDPRDVAAAQPEVLVVEADGALSEGRRGVGGERR